MATFATTGIIVKEHQSLTEIRDDYATALRRLTGKDVKEDIYDIRKDQRPSVRNMLSLYETAARELEEYTYKGWHSGPVAE